jgi:hypothetical protein
MTPRIGNGELSIGGRTGLAGNLSRDWIVAVFRYNEAHFRKPALMDAS